jgi:hypothetical protein
VKSTVLLLFSSAFPGLFRATRICVHRIFPVGFVLFLLILCSGCASNTSSRPLSTLATQTIASPPVPTSTLVPRIDPSNGWNTLAFAQPLLGDSELFHVMNYDYLTSRIAPFLAQTLSSPGFDGISPNGQDLLYQLPTGNNVVYYHALQTPSITSSFYTLPANSAGNALWLPDSQHVLVLMRTGGVMQVDTKSGQIQLLFSLPLGQIDIASLTFFRNSYLYFVGAAGSCEEILCRVKIGSTAVQRISFRSVGAHYWLSPDGSTIFFANTQGPAGQPGIYAVNVDGSHLRLLRSYSRVLPIGFAADNGLVILRQVQQNFVVFKLGATMQDDQVLASNAAPGAISLCPPDITPGAPTLCDSSIALAPYGHTLVVQATFADATSKLWATNLDSGKQQILQVGAGVSLSAPVLLLGWDRLPVSS